MKKALVVVLCIVVCIAVVVGGTVGFAQTAVRKGTPDAFLSEWMGGIADDALLKTVVIPGSHDSGTYGMNWMAETQDKNIAGQLACGVRYFDVRVTENKGKFVIYHGPIEGKEAIPMLKTFAAFVTAHPTETVIVDFQHFENGAEESVLAYVKKEWRELLLVNDTERDDLAFIDGVTMATCRGKIVVFVSDAEKAKENCFFLRSGDEGDAEGSSLQSYYDKDKNEGNAAAYVRDALPYYISRFRAYDKGLFVLQGQLTDKLYIFGPKFREAQNVKGMDAYVLALNESADLATINIVMRDYVSADKCAAVVKLNVAKGTVKPASAPRFIAL